MELFTQLKRKYYEKVVSKNSNRSLFDLMKMKRRGTTSIPTSMTYKDARVPSKQIPTKFGEHLADAFDSNAECLSDDPETFNEQIFDVFLYY